MFKKYSLILLISLILAVLVFAVVKYVKPEPQPANNENIVIANGEFCSVGVESTAKIEAAYKLASQSDCAKIGTVKRSCSCNEEDGKCRFDFDLTEKTKTDNPNCQPVCLVDTAKKTAEIDWRCPDGVLPKL